jgi:hypothetical protein
MPSLSRELRRGLENVTKDARSRAEAAARAALENLAVHERQARGHMDELKRKLRTALRARGKALGDARADDGAQELTRLVEHTAYEHWHRLLFTRFLTENHLLAMPDDSGGAAVAVTVEECDELAPEMGAKDGFDLACRFARRSLPGVFRDGDPILDLTFAPEGQIALRKLVDSLAADTFLASDSLGWTYQFWQADQKEIVNKSGKKIGADELSPVTQLFTEDYMVDFLLDNTLGAWHAGKVLAANPKLAETAQSEDELRKAVALPGCPWSYLRFIKGKDGKWTPAAGTFDGWPKTAKELRALDPCMGSGHFVVAMFERLVALRLAEEKLDEAAALAAVIRDNLFGLEIDPRCTQIGAFNLALAAWRRVGHCQLPAMNLACSGLAPNTREADWLAIAGDNEKLRNGMERLYRLFQKAAVLGSLINPRAGEGDLLVAAFHELQPLLEKALAQETRDDTTHEMAVTARGLSKAAEILAGQFTLVATNVPFLATRKQDETLMRFLSDNFYDERFDLAAAFVKRSQQFLESAGTIALVSPQSWQFLGSYEDFRREILCKHSISFIARLGAEAFETISGQVVNVAVSIIQNSQPGSSHSYAAFDVSNISKAAAKAEALLSHKIETVCQARQLENADAALLMSEQEVAELLQDRAGALAGIATADSLRFYRVFWEVAHQRPDWEFMLGSLDTTSPHCGRSQMVLWEEGKGSLYEFVQSMKHLNSAAQRWRTGQEAWNKSGVAVSRMGQIVRTLYAGEIFDQNVAVILPNEGTELAAIWAYCESNDFVDALRRANPSLAISSATVAKVPFDLAHWEKVAAEKYPHGLPKPFSSDPTQWLFNGHPAGADQPLHVAVARLLGYQWPRQTGSSFPDCPALGPDGLEKLADADGIVCLPPLNREAPAAQRLRALLAAALGKFDERALIAATDSAATNLEDWLRDEFFEQHCALFHHRPFVWHIWDGRKDGFHALLNYHRLDHGTLEKLTFSYLGDWIRQQSEDAKADKPGAAARLGAAQTLQDQLKAILEGEAPYDIFVRWKPLDKQAIGWQPDFNDGVRMNIRPFLLANDVGKKGAGILRAKPNVKWDKDRGKEPERPRADYPWFWCEAEPTTTLTLEKTFTGHRWNAVHLPLATKRVARG